MVDGGFFVRESLRSESLVGPPTGEAEADDQRDTAADPRPPQRPGRVPRLPDPNQLRRPAPRSQVTGAQSLVRSLEAVGVEVVFGIPGGTILPAYDPLLDSTKVRHVLVRHEQGAGHAATGYAQATGKVGVCMATSGPGATNLVTPLADANMDSVPVVAITGQQSRGPDRHRRVPGSGHLRHHAARHQAQLPRQGPRGDPAHHRRGVPHRRAPADPAPCSSTSPRTCCRRPPRSPGRPRCGCPATSRRTRPHGKQDREAAKLVVGTRAPGVLRGRRRASRLEAAAELKGAGRADRHPGGHDADGQEARSPTRTPSTSACPACTARSPRWPPCSGPTC